MGGKSKTEGTGQRCKVARESPADQLPCGALSHCQDGNDGKSATHGGCLVGRKPFRCGVGVLGSRPSSHAHSAAPVLVPQSVHGL